ncbi:hypothetical protein GH714_018463 [Hevea brasiliensis]|uniref:Uncharacterized protein n=1 Tax=Hevea brasiliensis TaxID=3981 RepID=A0A6A6N0X4_HEVBR|nr:hypothetical protein GH714_018463 [Hevea brasiliensis]
MTELETGYSVDVQNANSNGDFESQGTADGLNQRVTGDSLTESEVALSIDGQEENRNRNESSNQRVFIYLFMFLGTPGLYTIQWATPNGGQLESSEIHPESPSPAEHALHGLQPPETPLLNRDEKSLRATPNGGQLESSEIHPERPAPADALHGLQPPETPLLNRDEKIFRVTPNRGQVETSETHPESPAPSQLALHGLQPLESPLPKRDKKIIREVKKISEWVKRKALDGVLGCGEKLEYSEKLEEHEIDPMDQSYSSSVAATTRVEFWAREVKRRNLDYEN